MCYNKYMQKKIAKKLKINKGRKISRAVGAIEFQTLEFPYFEKGGFWFASVAVISAALVINFILAQKYFLTFIFLVALVVFLRLGFEKPKKIAIKIDSNGLRFRHRFYPWSVFTTFGILTKKTARPRLYLYFPGLFSIPLLIQIPNNISLESIKKSLSARLPEKNIKRLALTDAINQYLKF